MKGHATLALCALMACLLTSESVRPVLQDASDQGEKDRMMTTEHNNASVEVALERRFFSSAFSAEQGPTDEECNKFYSNRRGGPAPEFRNECSGKESPILPGTIGCKEFCEKRGCTFHCQDEDTLSLCDCSSESVAVRDRRAITHANGRARIAANIEDLPLAKPDLLHPLVKLAFMIDNHAVDLLKLSISGTIAVAGMVATGGGVGIVIALGIAWNALQAYLASRQADNMCDKGFIFLRFFIVNGATAVVGVPGLAPVAQAGMGEALSSAAAHTAEWAPKVNGGIGVADSVLEKASKNWPKFKKFVCSKIAGKAHIDAPCSPMPRCLEGMTSN